MNQWYFGMKEKWKVGEIVFCYNNNKEIYGYCKVLGYDVREYKPKKPFKVVHLQNLETGKDEYMNQGWMTFVIDKMS